MSPYKAASVYIKPEEKDLGEVFRGYAKEMLIVAFVVWVCLYAPTNRVGLFLTHVYVWGYTSLLAVILMFIKKLGAKITNIDHFIWIQSWAWPLRTMHRIAYFLFDATVVYCLIHLHEPIAAWYFGVVHIAGMHLYLMPVITPKIHARVKELIPADMCLTVEPVKPIQF
jgi:hypothetical protein